MSQKFLAIIPARKGSKGIPRKNVRELGDKPLIAHAIETCRESSFIDHVALTTDSQEIEQIGRQFGVDSVVKRPAELGADDVPLAPVTQHAHQSVSGDFEYVVCFQPTVPLVTTASLDEGIASIVNQDADSGIFVKDSTHHYWKQVESGYEAVSTDRKNRQQMDRIVEEIGVFVTGQELISDGHRVGDSPVFYEVEEHEGIDIDTYTDWILAESSLDRKEVVYRLIGNAETGTGHVFRGITIADHLFEHDIRFAVCNSEDLAIDALEESNYEYDVLEDDTAFLNYIGTNPPAVVVNDILDTTASYVETLSKLGPRVINFEDLGDGTVHADAVINALYEHSNPPANHYFGFQYFCLRNEFRYATPKSAIPSVDQIMVSFGGTDENNLTAKTLGALSKLDKPLHIDVILGLGYTERESLEPLIESYPEQTTVTVNQDVDSMAEHMQAADLLVTSNGRTLYEAGSLNLPVISIAQNQRELRHPYAHISQGIVSLGEATYVTESNILTAVEDYITDEQHRETMRQALAEHDIENGINRIKAILFGEDNGDW